MFGFYHYLCGMIINPTTSVKRIGIKRTEKIAEMVIDWCKVNLGVNRRRKSPITHLCIKGRVENDGSRTFGWYDPEDNIIGLSYNLHNTLGDLIQTIIHEYVHSMQPVITKYKRLYKTHGYKNHPFEIEARVLADQLHYKCLQENKEILKNILTK
jgi:hypothetical protein